MSKEEPLDHLIHGLIDAKLAFDLLGIPLPSFCLPESDRRVLRCAMLGHHIMFSSILDHPNDTKIMGFQFVTPSSSPSDQSSEEKK